MRYTIIIRLKSTEKEAEFIYQLVKKTVRDEAPRGVKFSFELLKRMD